MTKKTIIRLRLEVKSDPKGWQTTYVPVLSDGKILEPLPAHWPADRMLGGQPSATATHVFPRLPAGSESINYTPPDKLEAGVAEDVRAFCTGADPDKLEKLYTRIIRRKPQANDVLTYGCYLFETLIGRTAWKAILQWAADSKADLLDIALSWAPNEIHLHRLNWEMMYGPAGFLAARQTQPPQTVVITRMVKGATCPPQAISEVPRYLFVIGAPISNEGIRPGAELLGLLRGVEQNACSIHTRMLDGVDNCGATPSELAKVVKDFRPHIVHFTCHGKFDGFGGAALTLQPDLGDPLHKKDFDTDAIFAILSQSPIAAVVLSACNTGQVSAAVGVQPAAGTYEPLPLIGAYETAPMAAGLVKRGIPVVVGMAGQVADSACRHFTRCFGQAIVDSAPLVEAAAEGRLAAFAYGQSVETSVDWAFPALFLSELVPPDFTPLQSGSDTESNLIQTWIYKSNLNRPQGEPIFCGRDEFLEAFYHLFEPSPPAAMAIWVESGRGYGKSRLLEELAMIAMREGHVPVPLIHISAANKEPPRDLQFLRSALLDKLGRVLGIYATTTKANPLPPLPDWCLKKLAGDPQGLVPAGQLELSPEKIEQLIQLELMTNGNHLTGRALALALGEDLTKLAAYVRSIQPFVQQHQGRPVLLLDDVQLFGKEFIESWFDGNVLTGYGLGQDAASRIPVVMSLSLDDTGGTAAREKIESLLQAGHAPSWIKLMQLGNFLHDRDKDLLVYEQIWLHPFNSTWLTEDLKHPWTLAPNVENKRNTWITCLRKYVGFPQKLIQEDFSLMTEQGVQDNYLQIADDRKVLDDYLEMKKAAHAGG